MADVQPIGNARNQRSQQNASTDGDRDPVPACALQQRGLDRALGCFPGVANALGFRVLIRMALVRPLFGEGLMPVGFGIQKGPSVASEIDQGLTVRNNRGSGSEGAKEQRSRNRPELSRSKKTPPVFYRLTGHLELSLLR